MYIPKLFENNNIEQLHQLIERYNFATLISMSNNVPHITHVPLLLNREQGKYGTLYGHMAKRNLHLNEFDGVKGAVCIFHGPHAYISPTWYASPLAVPTWNYAVVHVHGIPKLVNEEQLSDILSAMVNSHETGSNYTFPNDHANNLMKYITGFEMEIVKMEGQFKLSQNHSQQDQHSVLEGLRKGDTHESFILADFMESLMI